MTGPSLKAVERISRRDWRKMILIFLIVIITTLTMIFAFKALHIDPYITESIKLEGSPQNGEQLFRINCVGCHGISGQGLLGPNLQQATKNLSDPEIINQIIKGRTPPMPSFEIETQEMADLLSYLHTLS